jgi:hypothetical protein
MAKNNIKEFSFAVYYTSKVLNSTLQGISEFKLGGGLNLTEFQFVDCKFSNNLVFYYSNYLGKTVKLSLLNKKFKC